MSDYLVCALVSEMDDPVEGSHVRWCSICAEEIWVSPSSIHLIDVKVTPVCGECVNGLPTEGAEIVILPEVEQELRAHGFSPEAIKIIFAAAKAGRI
jgi:hypothetical protein